MIFAMFSPIYGEKTFASRLGNYGDELIVRPLDVVPSMARMVGTSCSVRMASASIPPSMILPGIP